MCGVPREPYKMRFEREPVWPKKVCAFFYKMGNHSEKNHKLSCARTDGESATHTGGTIRRHGQAEDDRQRYADIHGSRGGFCKTSELATKPALLGLWRTPRRSVRAANILATHQPHLRAVPSTAVDHFETAAAVAEKRGRGFFWRDASEVRRRGLILLVLGPQHALMCCFTVLLSRFIDYTGHRRHRRGRKAPQLVAPFFPGLGILSRFLLQGPIFVRLRAPLTTIELFVDLKGRVEQKGWEKRLGHVPGRGDAAACAAVRRPCFTADTVAGRPPPLLLPPAAAHALLSHAARCGGRHRYQPHRAVACRRHTSSFVARRPSTFVVVRFHLSSPAVACRRLSQPVNGSRRPSPIVAHCRPPSSTSISRHSNLRKPSCTHAEELSVAISFRRHTARPHTAAAIRRPTHRRRRRLSRFLHLQTSCLRIRVFDTCLLTLASYG